MKIRVLGCSGGIGGRNLRTTALLVDHDILIDGGTGVGELSLEELARIDHVFVTHSHLDHIACIPFIMDTVGDMRSEPLVLHTTRATEEILATHIFNWSIWPDFTKIPSPKRPLLRFEQISVNQTVEIGRRRITALPANHTVPAVGYQIDSGRSSLVYTGDTTTNDALWETVNRIPNLRYLVVETAFSDRERELAVLSKHLCPSMLSEELSKLDHDVEVFITHLKPGQVEVTMQEIEAGMKRLKPRMLRNDQVFAL